MNLHHIAVGSRFHTELPQREGAFVQFTPAGLTLIIALPNAVPQEVKAFKAGSSCAIGITTYNRLGFLLVDFGMGINFDMPFDAGLEHPENLPKLELSSDIARLPLTMIGVDGITKVTFGLRHVTASPRVSREIVKKVAEQVSVPTTYGAHTSIVHSAYARFPNWNSIKAAALAFDKAAQ